MTARARRNDESFGDYRESLKNMSRAEKLRLKGRWIWRSFFVDKDEEGNIIKQRLPPYRKPKEDTSEQD